MALITDKVVLNPKATGDLPAGTEGSLAYDSTTDSLKQYGTSWSEVNATLGSENNPADSISALFDANTTSGATVWMRFSSYQSNAKFQAKYSIHDSKGWIEVLWSSNPALGTPWGNWNSSSGASALLTHNVDANGSIRYSGVTSSSIAVGSAFSVTDFALTTKSSVTSTSVAATGGNEFGAYPIRKAQVMGNSTAAAIVKILDYWEGSGSAVHVGSGSSTSGNIYSDSDAHMRVTGASSNSTLHFELMLGMRDASVPGAEWGIDGNSTAGSTHGTNWGYRNSGSGQVYDSYHVGSWNHSESNKGSTYEIDSGNVLSVWITSM